VPVEQSTDIEKMNEDTKNLSGCLVVIIVAVAAMSGSYLFSSSEHIAILDDGKIYSATDKARAYFQEKRFWKDQLQEVSKKIDEEKTLMQMDEEFAGWQREKDEKRNYCDEEHDDSYQYCQVSDPETQEKIYQLINADNEKERVKGLAKNKKEHLDEIARLNNLYSIAEKRSK
jgi:hypothetical protein